MNHKAPLVFTLLVFSLAAMTYADYVMSYNAVQSGQYREANPLAKGLIEHPALALPVITIGTAGISLGMFSLHKQDSTMAWILTAGLFVLHGFVLYHNLKIGARF